MKGVLSLCSCIFLQEFGLISMGVSGEAAKEVLTGVCMKSKLVFIAMAYLSQEVKGAGQKIRWQRLAK